MINNQQNNYNFLFILNISCTLESRLKKVYKKTFLCIHSILIPTLILSSFLCSYRLKCYCRSSPITQQ